MCCFDYKTQTRLFESIDEYLEKGDDPFSIEVATKFAEVFYNVDPDYEKTLTEFKFLKRFNFIDDDGFFINENGEKVNINGDLIKEEDEEEFDVMTAEFEDDIKPKRKTRKKQTEE